MDIDYGKYVGIPYNHRDASFDGIDCYGMLQLLFKEELGIELADYTYNEKWYEHEDLNYIVEHARDEGFYQVDSEPFDKSTWNELDVILFSTPRTGSDNPNHCGIWIPNERSILHSYEDSLSGIERLNMRFEDYMTGVYRHNELV